MGCLFPFFLSAQDCKLSRETDPYTKETKLSTGFISLPGAKVTIDADSKEIDFFFIVPDKCFNDASTVFILYEGNRVKLTYRSAGSMNCDGYFHFKFRNNTVTPTVVQKFSTQKIAQFIFTGNDKKAVTINLSPEQQKIFMEAVGCLAAEAKTLIK
jgi:hypothetical protein